MDPTLERHAPSATVVPLLLAGGQSTRFGSPKQHAIWTDGRPLYMHMLECIKAALPNARDIFISVRASSQSNDRLILGNDVKVIYDNVNVSGGSDDYHKDIGPAAGLLAAYALQPEACWLVVACDYPLMSTAALLQLCNEYQEPVTCFRNLDGFPEPLLAIWSPLALQHLQQNVGKGILGPSKVIRDLQGKTIVPANQLWLTNTNTQAEFQAAISVSRN